MKKIVLILVCILSYRVALIDLSATDYDPPIIDGVKDVKVKAITDYHSDDHTDLYAGITAIDSVDGDLTDYVWIEGYYDLMTPGTYQLSYTVSDYSGNTAYESFVLTVEGKDSAFEVIGKTSTIAVVGTGTVVVLAKLSVFDKLVLWLSKFDWFAKLKAFLMKKLRSKGLEKLKKKLFKNRKGLSSKKVISEDNESQGIKVSNLVFISGQLPVDVKGDTPNTVREQTQLVMNNIEEVLKQAKYTLKDIVKTRIYLSSMDIFGEVNEVYAGYFEKPFPARSTVEVNNLPTGMYVKIEAIAHKK